MTEFQFLRPTLPTSLRSPWLARFLALACTVAVVTDVVAQGAQPPAFAFTSRDSVLVVAPHPDDESLCCAGIIARALAQGARVGIVWVTSGDAFEMDARVVQKSLRPGQMGLRRLGVRRAAEAMAAADRLGVGADNRFLLGYPDRGIERLLLDHYYVAYESRFTGESKVPFVNALSPGAPYTGLALERDLRTVIERQAPTYVFVASPLDAHPDHRTSGEFVIRIMGERGQLDRVYYWIVHGGFDWPRPRGLHRLKSLIPPARARALPWVSLDLTAAEEDSKLEAIHAHRTQLEIERRFLEAFVRRNEIFTRAALEAEAPVPVLINDP